MKAVFLKESDKTWCISKELQKEAIDGFFSPNEIATCIGISKVEAQRAVDDLEERGLCYRVDHEYSKSRTGDERWCLLALPLTAGKVYEVLAIVEDDFVILNDPETKPYGNDPIAVHNSCFELSDLSEPDFWDCTYNEDGIRSCFPPGWNRDGFFEDYHDKIDEVREKFLNDLKMYFPFTWAERMNGFTVAP